MGVGQVPENVRGEVLKALAAGSVLRWVVPLLTLLVSGLVYITGGPTSPFLFLYLPVVMFAASAGSRTLGLLTAFANAVAYTALALMMLARWLPPLDGVQVHAPQGGIVLQVIGLCSGMILVAVLTSYLARKLQQSYELIEQSQRHFDEYTQQQSSLMNELPTGVITVDVNGAVSSVNQQAVQLLASPVEAVAGQNVTELLSPFLPRAELHALLTAESEQSQEIEWSIPGRAEPYTIMLRTRPVLNEAGERSGVVLILHDVTQLRSAEELLAVQERMARMLASRASTVPSNGSFQEFVGESAVMQKVFNLIERVAPSEATVLVHGESGTGKELVARALHNGSNRRNGPFIPVNCGAIPENLIESELFGHKKGAFTGADSDAPGLFREAEGGTLFLDEIGELPLQMQAKLLRVLQEKTVRPVGGTRDLPVDVRIIAATNRNLKKEVERNAFREDLFYRLNVIGINLPPLRERKEDLPGLVNSILQRLVAQELVPVVPPATMQLLLQYSYPGNVRELENILERAVVLGGEVILPEHLPEAVRNASPDTLLLTPSGRIETQIIEHDSVELPVDLDKLLGSIERRYLELALSRTNGAKKRAAELLGMNFRSFRYRLQKFGLQQDEDGAPNESPR